MKQYYIYINNNQIGPLSLDDLKQQAVSADTLIWYNGLIDWQKATLIEELKPFMHIAPPPANAFHTTAPPPIISIQENRPSKILGIRKNIFIYSIFVLALIISISAFSSYKHQEDYENDIHAIQLESYNQQIQEQQKAIEEQNKRIAEQERIAKEIKIEKLSEELNTASQNLELAKQQLHDATAFKLLRTAGERHEQVSAAEEDVNVWENKIAEIRREINTLQ